MQVENIEIVESFKNLTKNIISFFEGNVFKKDNVSCSELSILKVLSESEKQNIKMNVTELANELKMSKSAVSQLVSKLEKKGFVKRKINLIDKKINYLTITDIARENYQNNRGKYNEIVNKVVSEMGEVDSKELSRLLKKLSDIIYSLGGDE